MRRAWIARGFVWALCLFLLPVAAWAQGYTVSNVSGRYQTPPSTKTGLNLSAHTYTTVTLPFSFTYFGNSYTSAVVGDEGYMQISPTNTNTSGGSTNALPGSYDGIIAPAWYGHLHCNGGSEVNTFLTGTAPNRVFYVTWEAAGSGYGIYAQIQLYEASGRIVFAYQSGGSWPNGYYLGLRSPGSSDTRYMLVDNSNSSRSGFPSHDTQFDPIITTYTGRLLMDRPVVDATGIGNTTLTGQAVGGAQIELVNNSGGGVVGRGTTAADGAFTVLGLCLNPSQSGQLRVAAYGDAAIVKTNAQSNPITLNIGGTVSFSAGSSLGSYTLNGTTDPGGTMRQAVNILSAIQRVYEFAVPKTSDSIARLDVYFDPAASLPTSFTKAGAQTSATMQVGGPSANNPDQWDDDEIARVYALHVFQSITGVGVSPTSLAYDQTATETEAIALGFGWYLQSLMKGSTTLYDGLGANSATTTEIESGAPSRSPAATVPGWAAMAFNDLVDPANESHDWIDGVAQVDRPFRAVDALTSTTLDFEGLFAAFVAQGGNATGAARIMIRHGVIGDDSFEANDASDEAKSAGTTPLIHRNLVLNISNEDWYRLTVPHQVAGLNVDVVFDPLMFDTNAALELRNGTTGAVIGTGTPSQPGDPVRYVSGALPAGSYLVRVAHQGGALLSNYTLQAYESLEITQTSMPDWTVDIAYSGPLGVRGGIPGYKLSAPSVNLLPPGLVTNDTLGRLGGTPTQPGSYSFTIIVNDAADPPNQTAQQYSLTVNPHLQVGAQEFTPLLVGKTDGFDFGRSGGTDPIVVSSSADGDLPGGLTLSVNAVKLDGVPTATGSAHVTLDAVDVAGDAVSKTTTVVVCAPYAGKNAPATLAAGEAACGWPVDAVKGSEITAAVKLGKKQPKRVLDFTVVDSRGYPVPGGTVTTGKVGKAGVKKLVAPATGRFFVLCSGETGDATELQATIAAVPPKKAAGVFEGFGGDAFEEIEFGALAGATFTLKGKPGKGSDVPGAQVLYLHSPDDRYIPASAVTVAEKGAAITISGTCDVSGTWTLRVKAKAGSQGDYLWSLAIKQPKGGIYAMD
jgi:hypothetical protein